MGDTRTLTEHDLFTSYWDDGLIDLLCGLAVLVTGLGWESDFGALAILQAPLWTILWSPLRHRIVEPRAGFVRFSQSRQRRTTLGLLRTLALGAGALVLTFLLVFVVREGGEGAPIERLAPALPAVLVAIASGLACALTGARRFLGYSLVLVIGAAATVVLMRGPAPPLALGGLVATLSGAVLLARFLKASRQYQESC
jgi:hypothetical protein